MKYFIFISLIAFNVFAARTKMPVQAKSLHVYITILSENVMVL